MAQQHDAVYATVSRVSQQDEESLTSGAARYDR